MMDKHLGISPLHPAIYTKPPFRQRKQGILMSPYMHLLGIASLCIHADEFGLEKECTIVNGVTARGQNRYNIKMS